VGVLLGGEVVRGDAELAQHSADHGQRGGYLIQFGDCFQFYERFAGQLGDQWPCFKTVRELTFPTLRVPPVTLRVLLA
jgi:hypothetical protein